MANTVKGQSYALGGGWLEVGTFTMDPASINAVSQGTTTVTITGAKTGDLIFVNPEGVDAGLSAAGAKITGANTATVYLNNTNDTGGAAVNGASITWYYILVHLS